MVCLIKTTVLGLYYIFPKCWLPITARRSCLGIRQVSQLNNEQYSNDYITTGNMQLEEEKSSDYKASTFEME